MFSDLKNRRWQAALVAAATACIGCNGGDAEMAPVTGTVTMNGQPVTGVFVKFQPNALPGETSAPTRAAMADVDSEGRYELSTNVKGDGAAVGAHTVTVVSVNMNAAPPGNLRPGHKVEVKPGDNVIDLELTPRRR